MKIELSAQETLGSAELVVIEGDDISLSDSMASMSTYSKTLAEAGAGRKVR